ncbi:hypothetical protein TX23_01160 [Pseudomonas paralactis]|uniref:SGNH hydrolase-type esterase domain-containing protein n=1 Tax=Pseudomonas paralactis TaxID=1615673 RepID=A0A0R3AVR3_9PSED|nr:hypothetical protein [Pseudomonas paralactis]KRP74827.1 hypothetical protein TX23_01160 [Pseudomonas paralactis]
MTVSTIGSIAEFDTNGVTTNYPFYFKFLANEDLIVTYIDPAGTSTVLTLGTHYTVNGAGNDLGGSIVTTTALAGPGQLVVAREMEAFQQTSLRNQGKFLAETHEDVFDRLTMLIQQGFSLFSRALKRPYGRDYFFAENRRIKNVLDPIDPQDAATSIWVSRFVAGVVGAITGPINNALNIFYRAPNGTSRVVQDIAVADGTTLVGRGSGTLEDFLLTLALKSELESTFEVGRADLPLDRVLDSTDYNSLNFCAAAAGKIRSIPLEASVSWKANTEVGFFNDSDAVLRIAPIAGVSIITPVGKVAKVTARGRANIRRITANRWHITGDLDSGKQYGANFAFGDSITFGIGSTPVGGIYVNGYVRNLATYQGRIVTISAVAASMVYDQAAVMFAFTIDSTFTTSLMIGTNDNRVYLDDAYRKDCFATGHLACLSWLAVPDTLKVFPNNAACTYTGSWGTSSYGKIFTRFTTTVGATVTVPFSGPVVYLNILRTDGNVATGEVRVDGVLRSTVNFAGPGTGTLLSPSPAAAGAVGPSALRIGGLSDGPHSLELKIITVGSGGSATFLGISVPPTSGVLPRVNAMTIIRSSDSSTDARVAAYNALIATNVAILKRDGLDIAISNTNAVIEPSTDLADTLHPNDQGHNKIARQAALDF